MPLLCPTVCMLLLLPLTALSCNSTKSLKNITDDYKATIRTELIREEKNIGNLLKNSTCTEIKHIPRCSLGNTSIVSTLFNIICKMKNLSFLTTPLTDSVLYSVNCHCEKTNRGRKRNVKITKYKRKEQKLCRAKTCLSSLAECYELLNTVIT